MKENEYSSNKIKNLIQPVKELLLFAFCLIYYVCMFNNLKNRFC